MVKIWDIVADKMREEYSPAQDIAVRSISIVILCYFYYLFIL